MNEKERASHIEALLFVLGKPLSRVELQKTLYASAEEVERAIGVLGMRSERSGIVLVDDGHVVELRVSANCFDLIERVRKEENTREIGKAGLETLAAILYRGPIPRSEVDFIRGVNSSQTIRTLLIRGLIRKTSTHKGARAAHYEPTTELLSELGLTGLRSLPEYTRIREEIATLEKAYKGISEESDGTTT